MSKRLFDEFNRVSAKQWKQKIQVDLKGADYNNTLIWKSNEDISVKPFYHADDFNDLPDPSNTKASEWKIGQFIYVADVQKSNEKAINLVKEGIDTITFIIPTARILVSDLLQNINLNTVSISFELQFLSFPYVQIIYDYYLNCNQKTLLNNFNIKTDIIGNLTKNGNWFKNLNDDFKTFTSIVKITNSFNVDGVLYQNAGANIVQQLAYIISHVNEYLNLIDNLSKQSFTFTFHVSVGTNYFFEIAKLRALRILWHTLASEYKINSDCNIVATSTKRNKTLYDNHTNMLRTTTECMSAIIGGANTIVNLPYDAIYHKTNDFSERMARNQLLILKHESHFDKVNNPADGAYYIETLTKQLAEKALILFKDIEANGGFLKQLKEGTIQRKIKENAEKEQKQFDEGKEILIGTNKHINPNDRMKQELELYPFIKSNPRKTFIEPIIEKRLSETLEKNRLKNEL
ncbi:methylmalonyl-CoA mutase [Pseudalgibacter alginicilyticus]|uniref:Methylmalonyl-CoA mutase n=1 Tax=Pseudalgibacter alginicilyticus TaxID=1736674 RepID=A0A0P0D810_9FLAO|nr:methylmalonyl-CoA mutase subunit beta [Pseudalgibacter alginicilyticus]ALJ06276.1 methylmalonyl-CoA mutase [Pseudalgibacter alginicilyticus]